MVTMAEKEYRRKPAKAKFVQYHGSQESREFLESNYLGLFIIGDCLYFDDNDHYVQGDNYMVEILEDDYIRVVKDRAVEVVQPHDFKEIWEEDK